MRTQAAPASIVNALPLTSPALAAFTTCTADGVDYLLVPCSLPTTGKNRAGAGCAAPICGGSLCRRLGSCTPVRELREGGHYAGTTRVLRAGHVWVARPRYDQMAAARTLEAEGYGAAPAVALD